MIGSAQLRNCTTAQLRNICLKNELIPGFQANYNQGDLLETMTNLKNAALTKNSKVIHMIDLADGELNENSYSEFSGYLNFDDTTDGIIYKNAKKAEVDAIRSGNPSYDIFYEINDPSVVMTDRQENEYFYQRKFTLKGRGIQ